MLICLVHITSHPCACCGWETRSRGAQPRVLPIPGLRIIRPFCPSQLSIEPCKRTSASPDTSSETLIAAELPIGSNAAAWASLLTVPVRVRNDLLPADAAVVVLEKGLLFVVGVAICVWIEAGLTLLGGDACGHRRRRGWRQLPCQRPSGWGRRRRRLICARVRHFGAVLWLALNGYRGNLESNDNDQNQHQFKRDKSGLWFLWCV